MQIVYDTMPLSTTSARVVLWVVVISDFTFAKFSNIRLINSFVKSDQFSPSSCCITNTCLPPAFSGFQVKAVKQNLAVDVVDRGGIGNARVLKDVSWDDFCVVQGIQFKTSDF